MISSRIANRCVLIKIEDATLLEVTASDNGQPEYILVDSTL